MHELFLEGLDPLLAPVCNKLDKLCASNNIKYEILEDSPDKQIYRLQELISLDDIRNFAANQGVVLVREGNNIKLTIHELAENFRDSFPISEINDSTAFNNIQNTALRHLGERYRTPFADHFKNFILPVRIHDVGTLWKTHQSHPRWNQLGNVKSQYVGNRGKFPPIVVDTFAEQQKYPAGQVVDGFRRLYAAHEHQEPLIEAVDIRDMVSEAQQKIEEDQYKNPTRRHLRKQSPFPSSFSPSKSFGGISGYNGKQGKYTKKFKRKVKTMREYSRDSFDEQLKDALDKREGPIGSQIETDEFENSLSNILGGVLFAEPSVLATVNQIIPKETEDSENYGTTRQ